MPNYLYRCRFCSYSFELYQNFNDNPKIVCIKCKKHQLYRDCSGIYAAIKKEPTTIEHLANHNTEKLGRYEYETKLEQEKQKRKPEKKKEMPFWRKGKIKTELMMATNKEKKDYIEKGILPPDRIKLGQEKAKERKKKK